MDCFEERRLRTQWFMRDRFGMFIHFGLYSIPGRGEWVFSDEKISTKEYELFFDEFNPERFDAGAWARTAKNAGMKYAVLTTKHHEGFCLFDSAYTDYKITKTAFGRDLVREYVDAFRAEGLKVGLYYSLLDWHHPDYPAYGDMYHPERENEEYKNKKHNFKNYLDYMHGQIRELITNYGKIDLLWLDFSYEGHSGDGWNGTKLIEMIRECQPEIVMNSRLESSGTHYGSIMTDSPTIFSGDFACPEMIIPPDGLVTPTGRDIPWEACFTLNNNWGYAPNDRHYKTASQIVKKLIECTSKGGNMILNVSPTSKGEIPQIQQDILAEVGQWMGVNGNSIYGCGKSLFTKPEWGRFTQNGNKLYAHITEESIGAIALPGLKGKIKKARRLADGFEMLMLTPACAKNFPGYEFINYGSPDYFSFSVDPSPASVIEIELR